MSQRGYSGAASHAGALVAGVAGFGLRLVAALVCTLASLALHLPTRAGRAALRDVAAVALPAVAPGALRIGRIDALSPMEVAVSEVSFADDRGAPVVEGLSLSLRPAWRLVPALQGRADLPAVRVRARRVWAFAPHFNPSTTPPEPAGEPPRLAIPSVTLDVDELVGRIPSVPLRAQRLHAEVGLRLGGGVTRITRFALRGDVDAMNLGATRVALAGRGTVADAVALDADASLQGAALRCDLALRDRGGGRILATVRDCALAAASLDRLAQRPADAPLGLGLRIEALRAEGVPGGELELSGSLALNTERVGLAAHLGPRRQTLDLTLHHLSAARVVSAAPSTDLHGVIRLRRDEAGAAQTLSLDTTALVASVAGVPVPPLSLRARVEGDQLTVERLAAEGVGLEADGGANLATGAMSFRAAATVDAADVATFPWVAGRASGALRARVSVRGEGDRIEAQAHARARSLRAGGASVAALSLDGELARTGARNVVTARLSASGASVGRAVRGASLDFNLRGDPTSTLRATLTARGDGLLAALGHGAEARAERSASRRSGTSVEARVAVDLSSPDRVRVELEPSSLRLRGATGTLTASVVVPRGAGTGGPNGRARLDLGARGAVAVTLGGGRAAVTAERFDLRWLHPFVADARAVEGVVDGRVALRPGHLGQTRAELRVSRASLPSLGEGELTAQIEPGRDGLGIRATLDTPRGRGEGREGLRATVDVRAVPPRRTGDVDAWLEGLRDAHLTLRHDLAAWDAEMPPGIAARGAATVSVDVTREGPRRPLELVARVDAPSLTVGVRSGSGYTPALTPLAARAVGCATLSGRRLDEVPLRLRVALGPAAASAATAASDCGSAPLLARSFVSFAGGLRGAWRDALSRLSTDLARSDHRVTPDTRAALRRTVAEVDASVGPIARSDWPLRAIPRSGRRGHVELVPAPDLPPASELHATLSTRGSLLDATTALALELRAPSLPAAGLRDPLRARVDVRVAPEGGDLLGRVGVRVEGQAQVGADAAGDQRGELRLDARAFGEGASLLTRGADAMTLDHLAVDTSRLRIERLDWAREKGLRGEVGLSLRHTRDPAAPVTLRAKVSGLRARLGASADARLSEPVSSTLNAVLRARGRQGWTLHACADAAVREEADAEGCDPMRPDDDAPQGALRASVVLPIEGTPSAPRPAPERAVVAIGARRFRLDALTPAVRGDGVGSVGGFLDGMMRWDPSGAGPQGELRVSEGTADVASVGERLHGLGLTLRAERGRIALTSAGFQLGDGRVTIRGEADVSGALARRNADDDPSRELATLRLDVETAALPLGAEGNAFGWVDGHLTYAMRFRSGGAQGELVIDRATVRLKEQETRDLQSMSVDPDIFEVGRTRPPTVVSASPYPMSVAFSIPNPLYLERSDLGVAIRGSGVASRERGGWGVAGLIERAGTRGWFAIFGKRFEIDRLRVGLDGGASVNPTLDISAAHATVTGDRLTATVGGSLRAPTLSFASANHPGASEVEVLAMLALGRSGSQSAQGSDDLGAQAGAAFASLLGAMTFGSLSRGMRIVPTLILEPGQGNAGRYGAGVALGPRFYLQATYGASGSASQSAASSSSSVFRVMLEVALSHAWSASVAATANAEAQGGGVDVFWSP